MSLKYRFPNILLCIFLSITAFCCAHMFFSALDQRESAKESVLRMEKKINTDDVKIGNKDDKYFWFLQITDLHLSKFRDYNRSSDLLRFLKRDIPTIAPDFILVSGDLTDAKTPDTQGSDQFVDEWKTYRKVIDESGILKVTKWFDLRGNHDSFNVPSLNHQNNLYSQYSVQGRQHRQSYLYQHRKPFGVYSVIAMDACPNPGPKRPYNFFGVVSSTTIQLIQHYSHLSRGSNATFWFGHYPTSTIVSPGYDLRAFIGKNAIAYMCGHLHTLGGRVPHMYSLQPQGYFELELGDWRDSRLFRVVAVDHDLVSFSDQSINEWPIVLVTNPKDATFLLPNKEPLNRIGLSTHIRILAFSPSPIEEVLVAIDGRPMGQAERSGANLYTLPWSPAQFSAPAHVIEVIVRDGVGRVRTLRQPFSVQGKPSWRFRYLPSLLLLGDVTHMVRVIYYTVWVSLLSPIVFLRFLRYKPSMQRFIVPATQLTQALYKFAQQDCLFYSWILYFLYSACGPIVIGGVISGGFNIIFVHGLYVNGVYIPEAFPYVTETLQNLLFMLPLLLYFSKRLSRGALVNTPTLWPRSLYKDLTHHWSFTLLLMWELLLTVFSTLLPYGLFAFLFSPCRIGCMFLAWFMHRYTVRVSL